MNLDRFMEWLDRAVSELGGAAVEQFRDNWANSLAIVLGDENLVGPMREAFEKYATVSEQKRLASDLFWKSPEGSRIERLAMDWRQDLGILGYPEEEIFQDEVEDKAGEDAHVLERNVDLPDGVDVELAMDFRVDPLLWDEDALQLDMLSQKLSAVIEEHFSEAEERREAPYGRCACGAPFDEDGRCTGLYR